MNQRIRKKKQKQIVKWLEENFDNYNPKTGEYKTVPIKCRSCAYYESGDNSVGLLDGCETPALYDKDDNLIKKVNDRVAEHMMNLGYTCPYYRRNKLMKRRSRLDTLDTLRVIKESDEWE